MRKIILMSLAGALFTGATPAVLAEDTNNIDYVCNDLGEEVQLSIVVEGTSDKNVVAFKKSVFPDGSATSATSALSSCEKAGTKLTDYLENSPALVTEEPYLRVDDNYNGSEALCVLKKVGDTDLKGCSDELLLLTRLSEKQGESLAEHLRETHGEEGATGLRHRNRGTFRIRFF